MFRQLPLPPPPPPSSSRSHNRKWIVIGVAGLLFVLVIVGAIASLFNNQPQNNNTNPIVTATPTATASPTPSPTPQPSKNIAISYSYQTVQSIADQSGYITATPDSGKVFLEVTMTITNNGYDASFSTNPLYFSVISNSVKYSSDFATFTLNKWDTVDLLNAGSYTGTMVFQVPSTASSFTMECQQLSLTNFNIIWTQT